MIRVLDTLGRVSAPAWMVGAADLQCRPCRDGVLWGIGDGALLCDLGPWVEIGDGYRVCGDQPPGELERGDPAWPTIAVADMRGQAWQAPAVLDEKGNRAFRVSFGPDWLPALTPAQARAMNLADEVRSAMQSGRDVPMAVCCQWSAEFLSLTHYLSPKVIAACGLLDEALVIQVMSSAAGLAEVSDG